MSEINNVVLIEKGTDKYIEKKLLEDINMEMCFSKMAFVNYLADHDVPVARIRGYEERNGSIFESQEYIESCGNHIGLEDCIKMAAHFHKVSADYTGNYLQKNVLNSQVSIAGTELNQVLLGFYEKYYHYAHQVFSKTELREDVKHTVFHMHDQLYREFCNIASLNECIIHNDLTPYNIIYHHKPVLIDFDLAIKSSVYVDAADLLFPRTAGIFDYLSLMNAERTGNAAELYNRFNDKTQLTVRGIKLMAALKLFTYLMYIYSQRNVFSAELIEYLKMIYVEALN